MTWSEQQLIDAAIAGDRNSLQQLRPLLEPLCYRPLLSQPDNYTPPDRTPWGGKKIVERYKAHLGLATDWIVGESWEISGHASFPSKVSLSTQAGLRWLPISLLEQLDPSAFLGSRPQMPFLVKLLNSGSWQPQKAHWSQLLRQHGIDDAFVDGCNYHELHLRLKQLLDERRLPESAQAEAQQLYDDMIRCNLSVQVHPPSGMYPDLPSKTEAWMILEAEPGAGLYLGLRDGIGKQQFAAAMQAGEDLSDYLNFVPVFGGEVFFIPAGTLHAIGAGIVLLEPQESSETTFRAYDWGRTVGGKPRQLHLEETIASTDWQAPTGQALVESLRCPSQVYQGVWQRVIEVPEFTVDRLELSQRGQVAAGSTRETGLQGIVVLEGTIGLLAANGQQQVARKGQSLILPAGLGVYHIEAVDAPAVAVMTCAP